MELLLREARWIGGNKCQFTGGYYDHKQGRDCALGKSFCRACVANAEIALPRFHKKSGHYTQDIYNTPMCGIAGVVGAYDLDDMTKALDAIAHRGPDARGVWHDDHAALGHVRLAIIDLDEAANQPMVDGDFVLVFNGEIYNYETLRNELIDLGKHFKTQSDSEVLLQAYKVWGKDCLSKLNGMFAFAIWNARTKTLFAARDRVGKKPFFYARTDGGGLAFASEPQALLQLTDSPYHHKAMQAYLALGYSTGEQTIWQNIKRLEAGCYLEICGNDFTIASYCNLLDSYRDKMRISKEDATQKLNALIDDATRLRLAADVPYGLFLSGGIDSNAVLASMVGAIGADKVRTFSIGFDENAYDEAGLAAQSAANFGTAHTQFQFTPDACPFEEVFDVAGAEPLADASILPTYVLAGEARKHVKMVLTGDGGEELFAGYPTYVADSLHRKISPFVPFMPPLPEPKARRTFYFKLHQFLKGLPMDGRRAHFSWRIYESAKTWDDVLLEDFDLEDVYGLFDRHYEDAKDLSPLDQALYVDTKTFLVDSVMVKADRASMAHGLEARAPLLDYRIVEFAARLPEDMKLCGRQGKYILREAQRARLPAFLFDAPKRGFSVPISAWLRGRLKGEMREALSAEALESFFDKDALSSLMDNHGNGAKDHGLALLALIGLARNFKLKETN